MKQNKYETEYEYKYETECRMCVERGHPRQTFTDQAGDDLNNNCVKSTRK